MRARAFLPFLAVVGCSEVVAPTQQSAASPTPRGASRELFENSKIELTPGTPVANPCNGETVEVNAVLHTMIKFTTPPSGNVSAFVSTTYDFHGTGTVTGAKYNGSVQIRDQEMANDNGTSVFHLKSPSFRIIGQGQTPDFFSDFTVKVVTANGETRVEMVDQTFRCHE